MTRIGLVSDVHWRTNAGARASGWHDAGAAEATASRAPAGRHGGAAAAASTAPAGRHGTAAAAASSAPSGWHGTGSELAGALERLGDALVRFAEHDVDLVVLAGDLTHHGEVGSLAQVLRACARASAPVLVVSGNHDVDGDGDRLARAHALATGHGRTASAVRLATPAGALHGDLRVAGVHVGETHGWFGARLRELPDTAAWGEEEPVVLVSHYPALSHATRVCDEGFPYPGDLRDRRELARTLADRAAPTLVLGGHVHARATRAEGPVLQLTSGALVEPPYECALIDVEQPAPGRLVVERTCLRLRDGSGAREPVFAPAHEAWLFDGLQWRTTNRGADDEAEQRQDPHDPRRQPAAT